MKNRYPRTRMRSASAKCPICGKTYTSMGMGTHVREAHKMLYTTEVTTVAIPVVTPTARPVATTTAKPVAITPVATTTAKPIIEDLSKVTGKDLTECKRPDGTHLYTDQDLWILLSRINKVVLGRDASSLLSTWDGQIISEELIRDFEQRFDCKFRDIQKVNPHIKPGKTDQENWDIASRYAHLKYSRAGGFLQENWTKE